MGILFIIIAIASWGVGDFLIQKSARKLGDWEALFFISLIGTVVLLPFVYTLLSTLSVTNWLMLSGTAVVILVAALLDFDALRIGKICIVEPIYALEVPLTIALGTLILGEHLSSIQILLIVSLLLGVFLVSNKRLGRVHAKMLEKGVLVAFLAMIGMGTSNFLFGISARATTPLMINWFTSAFMAGATLAYLLYTRQSHKLLINWKRNKGLITGVGLIDNLAWVAFSSSTLYLPIGLATGLTESYIALAALLGVVINKETLRIHQVAGLIIAVVSGISLALTIKE